MDEQPDTVGTPDPRISRPRASANPDHPPLPPLPRRPHVLLVQSSPACR